MRFNRFSCFIVGVLLLQLLFCTRSDVITGAGGRVVGDVDPALIDHSRGFVTVTLDGNDTVAVTDSSFSLPAEPDPLFGTYYDVGDAPIGVSRDGDMLAAHFQYSVTGGSKYAVEVAKPPAPYAPRLDSVFMCFPAIGGPSYDIALFYSDTLPEFAPVDRSDATRCANADETCGTDNSVGTTFSFNASGTPALVALPPDLAQKIYERRLTLSTDTSDFYAFSIPNYADSLLWIRSPYIIVRVYVFQHNIDDSLLVSDTIRGLTRYTAFETAENAAARRGLPYSSQFTRRTAVFRVDMSKVADTLESLGLSGSRNELLNAVAAVWHVRETDDTATWSGMKTRDGGNYKALILDTLLTREVILKPDSTEVSRMLRSEFATVGATKLRTDYFNTHQFKSTMRSVLDKYNRREVSKPYIYIYLRPVSDAGDGSGSAILWKKPLKTETVFTPSSRPQ